MKTVYLDIHAIQTVPPSCVNRDDTGSPKSAIYGGVERARVSSQAWKHAMRMYFETIFDDTELGSRTKQIPGMIAEKILELDKTLSKEEAIKKALEALANAGIKTDDKKGTASALFFISKYQVEQLAELAVAKESDKKAYKTAIKDNPAVDIALFGRMVADDPSLNYDAASQVAHAISTHGVKTEYDYFTAVDDEQAEDNSGAGHLGTIEFNSATLYRYATVNIRELYETIGDDTPSVVRGFVEAFVCSMPTGKQNTFANRTLPDMLYVTVREDQPVNLSGAFENAVKNDSGYVEKSCEQLLTYAQKLYDTFADKPVYALGCGGTDELAKHAEVLKLKDLLDSTQEYISKVYSEEMI